MSEMGYGMQQSVTFNGKIWPCAWLGRHLLILCIFLCVCSTKRTYEWAEEISTWGCKKWAGKKTKFMSATVQCETCLLQIHFWVQKLPPANANIVKMVHRNWMQISPGCLEYSTLFNISPWTNLFRGFNEKAKLH